jgi:hypothetical protein
MLKFVMQDKARTMRCTEVAHGALFNLLAFTVPLGERGRSANNE